MHVTGLVLVAAGFALPCAMLFAVLLVQGQLLLLRHLHSAVIAVSMGEDSLGSACILGVLSYLTTATPPDRPNRPVHIDPRPPTPRHDAPTTASPHERDASWTPNPVEGTLRKPDVAALDP